MLLALLRCFHFSQSFISRSDEICPISSNYASPTMIFFICAKKSGKRCWLIYGWAVRVWTETQRPLIYTSNFWKCFEPRNAHSGIWRLERIIQYEPRQEHNETAELFFSMHLYIRSFCVCSRCSKLTISSHPSWDFGCVHQPASQPAHLCRRSEWQIKIK